MIDNWNTTDTAIEKFCGPMSRYPTCTQPLQTSLQSILPGNLKLIKIINATLKAIQKFAGDYLCGNDAEKYRNLMSDDVIDCSFQIKRDELFNEQFKQFLEMKLVQVAEGFNYLEFPIRDVMEDRVFAVVETCDNKLEFVYLTKLFQILGNDYKTISQ